MWWSTVPKRWGCLVMKEHWGLGDIAVDVFWKVGGIKGCYLVFAFVFISCVKHTPVSARTGRLKLNRNWVDRSVSSSRTKLQISIFFQIREKVGSLFYFILFLLYEHLLLREMFKVFLKCKIKNVCVETAVRVSHLTLNILAHQTMV